MTIRWMPDTCQCVLLLADDGITYQGFECRCHIHKGFSGEKLDKAVKTHNAINRVSLEPSQTEIDTSVKKNQNEYNRIKDLGPAVHGPGT